MDPAGPATIYPFAISARRVIWSAVVQLQGFAGRHGKEDTELAVKKYHKTPCNSVATAKLCVLSMKFTNPVIGRLKKILN